MRTQPRELATGTARGASLAAQRRVLSSNTTCASNINLGQLSLQRLLELCLRGRDEVLWTDFIRRSQPVITGVIIKIIRRWTRPNPTLVDDLVQETYLKLCANDFNALRQFVGHHENALYGFLRVVAANTVQDHFRGFYSRKRGDGKPEEDLGSVMLTMAEPSGLSQDVERLVLLREIDECLANCPAEPTFPRDYSIFWLYYREGLTAKAISKLPSIGLSVKGVESAVFRMTRLVRSRLAARPARSVTATHFACIQ